MKAARHLIAGPVQGDKGVSSGFLGHKVYISEESARQSKGQLTQGPSAILEGMDFIQGWMTRTRGSQQKTHRLTDTTHFPASLIHCKNNEPTSNPPVPPNRILTCPGFSVSRPHSPCGSKDEIFPGKKYVRLPTLILSFYLAECN